jgi:holo-[acyl-carrier protein] synthase
MPAASTPDARQTPPRRALPWLPAFEETGMILGLGLDVVEVARIARVWKKFGARFAQKILHPGEMARLERPGFAEVQFLASRFAVKEAAVKALGTGFSQGILPTDIAVDNLPGGRPQLHFHGRAEERFRRMGADTTHLSLTHGKETVAAVVILEKKQG